MNLGRILKKTYWMSLYILIQASIFRQHKNSFLGSAWGLIQPSIHIVIISYVFSFLLRMPTETLVMNLVSSLPVWTYITTTLQVCSGSLQTRSTTLRRINLPKTLMPISDAMVNLYTLSYAFISMYIAFIIIYPSNFSLTILLAPITLAPMVISVVVVGVMFSYLTPYIMDIPQMVAVILNALYWAIPIVYPYSMVPEKHRWLFEINPLFHLIRPTQILVVEKTFPDLLIMFKALLVMIISGIVSAYVVKKLSRNVIYYL